MPHRVLIVGGGFGGLSAAKALGDADVEVTLVDRTNHHLFQPLLYQMTTGILSAGDIAPPIRDVLRRQRNTQVVLGEVVGIDPAARCVRTVMLDREEQLGYDTLIVAAGSQTSYFGHDEFAEHAPGMKTIDDALELRGRIFGAFELAERAGDEAERRRLLTFVVVGAGPTGVELAGQIAELSRRSLGRNFRHIDPSAARVVLLDGGPRVLAPFPETLQDRAVRRLRGLGVEVHLDALVTGVGETTVSTNAGAVPEIPAGTVLWAAGVEGVPLGRIVGEATGAEVARDGRVPVRDDLTVEGHEEIFVIGDLMSLDRLPGVAQVAIQAGEHAAETVRLRLRGERPRRPFRYRDKGTMATVSRFQAVATIGPVRASGFIGWLLWLLVHLLALTGFKNRIAVLFNWVVAFAGRGRPQRAITAQQVLGRTALRETGRVPR